MINGGMVISMNQNAAIRGYIMRMLTLSTNNTLLCSQISKKLLDDKMETNPDIIKHLDYIQSKGYIQFAAKNNAFITYWQNGPVTLTATGVDLVEGSITDPGVDI